MNTSEVKSGRLSAIDAEFVAVKNCGIQELDHSDENIEDVSLDFRCRGKNGEKLRLAPADSCKHSAHGFMGSGDWPFPCMTKCCYAEARPGYSPTLAHEYSDESAVLEEKVELLANLIRSARPCLLYTGAGLSTSAGIDDYATRPSAEERIKRAVLTSPIVAQPAYAHYVLAELFKRGLMKQWVQQNHDGLPQKADVPQSVLNEIHGAWFDPSNPVVRMDGNLRSDLFDRLLEWEKSADLTVSVGTSMSGMNSDRVFTTVAKKGLQQFKHRERNPDSVVLGGVIIGVQCTQLGIETPTCVPAHLTISSLSKHRPAEHQFLVPYDNMGSLCPELMSRGVEALMVLDLTPGKRVRLTSGPYEGDTGEVIEVSSQGMYQIQFNHEIDKKTKVRKLFMRPLGWWWIQAAVEGSVDSIPVVNVL